MNVFKPNSRFLYLPFLLSILIFSCTQKLTKSYSKTEDKCSGNQKPTKNFMEEAGLPADILKEKTGVFPMENGGESLIIRLWFWEHAQKTIDIQYYMILRDRTGLIATDYLLRAADRGVKVRILVDDATVRAGSGEINIMDSHENIEIKVYNPGIKFGTPGLRLKKLFTQPHQLNRRMHIKTIIIDDKASMIGGRNIGDEYYDHDKKYNFRDRDVLFIGKVTEKIKTSFEEYWNNDLSVPYSSLVRKKKKNEDPQRFNKIHNYVCDEKNFPPSMRERLKNFTQTLKTAADSGKLFVVNEVSYVADEPGKNKHKTNRKGGVCTDSLLALLKEAKHTVDIQTSYLITTDEGKKLLAELVKRGIRVRILTNSLASVDNFEAFSGYKRDRKKTLATGIEIYEFKPDAKIRYQLMIDEVQSAINYSAVYGFHSKSMVIDGKTSVIGSFNLDPRSANLNTECIAIFRSPEVAQHLSSFIEEEFSPENSWRITKDFNPDKKAGMKKRVKVAWRRIFPKVFL